MARPPAGPQRGEALADLGVAPQYLPQGRGCRRREDGREIARRWVSRIERRDDRVAGGRVGGRDNGTEGARGVHLRHKGDGGAPCGGAADRAACRFRRQAGDLGTERGDVAQQARRRRGASRRIAEEGLAIVADPQMERRQARCQLRMAVRRGQQIVYQGDRGDADGDRATTLHSR